MERYQVVGHLRLDPEGTVTSYADAQATVEALQAIIKQMGEQAARLAKDGMAAKAQVEALQRERDEARRKYHEAMDIMSAWKNIDHAEAVARLLEANKALDAEREKVARLEAAANYYKQPSKNGGVYSVSGGHIGNLMDWCKDNLKHCKFSGPDEDNLDLDLVQTAQQIPQLKTELSQLQALVRALAAKLAESDKASQGVFITAAMHGIHYNGPSYADELQALKAATLDAPTPATTKT